MGGRPTPEWKKERIKELWPDMTCKKISERLNMSAAAAHNIAMGMGLPKKGRGTGGREWGDQ